MVIEFFDHTISPRLGHRDKPGLQRCGADTSGSGGLFRAGERGCRKRTCHCRLAGWSVSPAVSRWPTPRW